MPIFAGSASRALGLAVTGLLGETLGQSRLQRFADGELCPVLQTPVQGLPVTIIQSTYPPAEHLLELLLMIDAAKQAGANQVNVVIPYGGYMRQDRIYESGSPLGAKLQASLLVAAGADKLIICDPHTSLTNWTDLPVIQLSSEPVFMPYLAQLKLQPMVFVAPDLGAIPRVQNYAHHFGVDWVACHKQRVKPNEVATIQVEGAVKEAHAVLMDDIIDTGQTICLAAEQLRKQGARSVWAFCTHALLSGQAYQRLNDSCLESLVVTDTIPLKKDHQKIKIGSLAGPIAQGIQHLK